MKRIVSILLLMSFAQLAVCGCSNQSVSSTSSSASEQYETQSALPASGQCETEEEETEESHFIVELLSGLEAEYSEYSSEGIECEPIDKSLDCEAILLEKAERLKTLMTDYFSPDDYIINADVKPYELVFKLEFGEAYCDGVFCAGKVISDEMDCYADFKAMFSDSIYGEFFDCISVSGPYFFDINGELFYLPHEGGLLGVDETWYIGYDVQDDRIIGHFAELRGLGEPEEYTAEYLNDESSYWFYDITVQCIDGVYVITDCREISSGKNYDYSHVHGFYNIGFADRTLITNEKVKPAFISVE